MIIGKAYTAPFEIKNLDRKKTYRLHIQLTILFQIL